MSKDNSHDKDALTEDNTLPKSWRFILNGNKLTLSLLIITVTVLLALLEGIQRGLGMLLAVVFGSFGFYLLVFRK